MSAPLAMRLFIKGHVALYQLTGGKLGGKMGGLKVVLLTMRGRKSGASRTVPLVPFIDSDKMYVVASMGGAPSHPVWYLNLKANPEVDVQFGGEHWHAKAVELSTAERELVWPKLTAAMPNFAEYQKKTDRVIPVLRLDRI